MNEIFDQITVGAVPLMAAIVALVQWLKDFGLAGKAAKLTAFLLGFVLGVGYMLTQGVPVDFAGWFTVIVFGLALGPAASKIYESYNPPALG